MEAPSARIGDDSRAFTQRSRHFEFVAYYQRSIPRRLAAPRRAPVHPYSCGEACCIDLRANVVVRATGCCHAQRFCRLSGPRGEL